MAASPNIALALMLLLRASVGDGGFVPLFPMDGTPTGWKPRDWSDVAKNPREGAQWHVTDGVVQGSTPRGTWLVSDEVYGDFVLDFDFRLGPQGNSGVGLRFPDHGDPAFDGLEVQLVDRRYYGDGKPGADELTGSIYKASAPRISAYRSEEWNHCQITCDGPRIEVVLNGHRVQDVNLDERKGALERGLPLSKRPRTGHIGFQELSRGGGNVEIRNAKIKVLKATGASRDGRD